MAALSWSTRNKSALVNLSGSNLISTKPSGGDDYDACCTQAIVPGSNYIEVVCTSSLMTAPAIGLVDAAYLTGAVEFQYGISILPGNGSGNIFYRGNNVANVGVTGVSGVNVGIAWTATKAWFRSNGGQWNGNNATNDPATNLGGIDISAIVGLIYLNVRHYRAGDSYTLKPTSGSWTYSAPAGFSEPVVKTTTVATGIRFTESDTDIVIDEQMTAAAQRAGTGEGKARSGLITPGNIYVEFMPSYQGDGNMNVGLDNGTSALNAYLGSDSNGIGYFPTAGQVFRGGGQIATLMSSPSGTRVCMAFNSTNVWWRSAAGLWNNSGTADPATNTGGIAHGLSSRCLASRLYTYAQRTELFVPSASWLYTPPSGFVQATEAPMDVRVTYVAGEAIFPSNVTTPEVRVTFAAGETIYASNITTPDVRVTFIAGEVFHSAYALVARRRTTAAN